jgi:UDP-N-acetylmuramyl pentapeptide phosphotransferase/UDP-N-acetylglucosamine-1-phosphate transferase
MATALTAFLISLIVAASVVFASSWAGHRLLDRDLSGPQKFHVRPVPRVGGLAIVLGVLGSITSTVVFDDPAKRVFALTLFCCAMPAFVVGIVQDVSEAIAPRYRLIATAVVAVLAHALLGAAVTRTDIPGLDWVVGFYAGSLFITVLSVAGIAHAINIIDGFNGLASMCVVIILLAVSYVAFQVDDSLIAWLGLAGVGAVLGFFLLNFPRGLIFLGDGGAYFLGCYVAELSVLLLVRNPEVSPLFPLLACIYPIFETLFSIYRRLILRAMPASMPDGIHLHSLIYRRVLRWAAGDGSARALARRNSMTSPYLWGLCVLAVVPATLFWNSSALIAPFLILFVVSYVMLYWCIVRFKAPRWLRLRHGALPHEAFQGDNPAHD